MVDCLLGGFACDCVLEVFVGFWIWSDCKGLFTVYFDCFEVVIVDLLLICRWTGGLFEFDFCFTFILFIHV